MNEPAVSTNQVRQILFNELGLTREFIREMVRDTVTATCEKYFRGGQFEKYVADRIDVLLRTYHYGADELKSLVANAVAAKIREDVMSRLAVEVNAKLEPTDAR